jgi:septum formation topological specificity factor MinE
MIQLENRFIEVFDTVPNIDFMDASLKSKYDFGTEADCIRFMTVNSKGKDKYPLIWLETPINLKGKEPLFKTRLKFILAYPTQANMENRQRLETYFKEVLDVMFDYVITALQQCGFVRFINQEQNTFARHYNYTNVAEDKSKLDIWDAIVFGRDVEINSSCSTKTINY